MSLLDQDLDQGERQEFVELDDIDAKLFLAAHGGARLLWRGDCDVAAVSAAVGRVGHYTGAANGAAGHPDARPADFAEFGPPLLRRGPGTILENLDGDGGGGAGM